jgi:hypothetical protein
MNKNKCKLILIAVFLLVLLTLPYVSGNNCSGQDNFRSNEDPKLVFYSHFDEAYKNSVDHYMNCHPGSDQKITLKQLAVNLDHTIRFILTPELVGEIFIADTAPTGGEDGKFFHSIVYMSASRVTERVLQTISLGTESDYEKYGTQSGLGAVGINPSQNQKTIESNYDSITSDENLVVTINTQYTGATPTSFHMHFGPSYPTGITLRYTNKITMDISTNINDILKEVTVEVTHNNPLGDDNMDHEKTTIQWTGPTTPNTIIHQDNTFTWIWDYGDDSAKTGEYSVEISVADLQGHTISDTESFSLEKDDQDVDGDSQSTRRLGLNTNTLLVLTGIVIIVFIIVILWLRKKRKS